MMKIQVFVIAYLVLIDQFSLVKTDNNSWKGNAPVIEVTSDKVYFQEQFQDSSTWSRWIRSEALDENAETPTKKYQGTWDIQIPSSSIYKDDYGLIMKSKSRFYAISAPLGKRFDFTETVLIIQFEVKYAIEQECGGAYIKLLSDSETDLDLKYVNEKTPYTIMFGPDTCGGEDEYHFIINYKNPKTGIITTHHAKQSEQLFSDYFTDGRTHIYTLVLTSNTMFQMFIDNALINQGNLLEDLIPPIAPPKEIDDPNDTKPDYWDDRESIIETVSHKSDDWNDDVSREISHASVEPPNDWLENEPLMIVDTEDKKPDDWNEENDGQWTPKSIENPRCKNVSGCGKWLPKMIPNPNYQGIWKPRKMINPEYTETFETFRLTPIVAVSLELWSVTGNVIFDNFLITSDKGIMTQFIEQLWTEKAKTEEVSDSKLDSRDILVNDAPMSLIEKLILIKNEKPSLIALIILILLSPIFFLTLIYRFKIRNFDKPKWRKMEPFTSTDDDQTSSDGSTVRARRVVRKE